MRKAFLYFSLLVILGGVGFSVYSGFTTEWNFEEQPDSACPDSTGGPAGGAPAPAAIPAASEQAKCWTGGPEEWGGMVAGIGIVAFGGLLLTIAVLWNISARRTSRMATAPIGMPGTIPSSFGIPPSGTMAPPSPTGSSPPPPPPSGPLVSG